MLKNCFCFAGMLQIMPQNGKVLSWNVAPQEHVFSPAPLQHIHFQTHPPASPLKSQMVWPQAVSIKLKEKECGRVLTV